MHQSNTCYLVYFNCRGTGHYYRYLLYQLAVPYQQIHIQSNGNIPECLKQYNISLDNIPCIIYKQRVIKDLYPTLRYLCREFGREDLLGSTLEEQIKISELYCKNSKKKSQAISMFLNYVPQIKKNPQKIKQIKLQILKSLSDTPGCSQAMTYLYAKTGNFLFDHLTIADFLFYQNCYYFSGFFADVCKKSGLVMFAYKSFFERTDFYKKNRDRIQGFQFVVPEFNEELNEGFKVMWTDKSIFN